MSPETDKPKEVLFAELLETSWSKLPKLLGSLPQRQQLQYKMRLTHNSPLSIITPWKKMLEKLIATTQHECEFNSFPSYKLNDTEARLYIMSVPSYDSLYLRLLTDLGHLTVKDSHVVGVTSGAAEFNVSLVALNSQLPHNRRGRNAITPDIVPANTINQGLNFIKNL